MGGIADKLYVCQSTQIGVNLKNRKKIYIFILSIILVISAFQSIPAKADELITMCIGWTKQLSVDTKKTVTWSSSDKSIATVSSKGLVTGKGVGVVVIKAKYGNNAALWVITVKPSEEVIVYEHDVSKPLGLPGKKTLIAGKSTILKLNGIMGIPTWSSSNKAVATVSSKGKVTAKKPGTVTITATVDKKKYTCKITVKAQTLSANKSKLELSVGDKAKIIITLKTDDEESLSCTIKLSRGYYEPVASAEFGEWDGYKIPLYITAIEEGDADIIITTVNSKEKIVVPITVNEN